MFHYKNKQIIVYHQDIDKEQATLYNGEQYSTMKLSEIMDIRKRPFDYSFILIKTDDENLEEYYQSYTKDVKDLYDSTDGYINLYRCNSVVQEGLRVFKSLQDIEVDPIQDFEVPYISSCGGGMRIGEKYEGPAWKYDKRSFYPFIMSTKLGFPIKQGSFKEILKKHFNTGANVGAGIYHCKIEATNPKLFTELKSNMYTHHEVNWAKKLGLKMELLEERYLSYERELSTSGGKLFGKYTHMLYPLKIKGNKLAKLMLNSLWGFLVSKNHYKYYRVVDEMELRDTDVVLEMMPQPNGKYMFKICNKNNKSPFKYDYARIKPFLLGYGRVYMHRQVQYHGAENIVFSHTDSIISKVKLNATNKRLENEKKIGSWHFEGRSDNCKIYNKNKYDFNYT